MTKYTNALAVWSAAAAALTAAGICLGLGPERLRSKEREQAPALHMDGRAAPLRESRRASAAPTIEE